MSEQTNGTHVLGLQTAVSSQWAPIRMLDFRVFLCFLPVQLTFSSFCVMDPPNANPPSSLTFLQDPSIRRQMLRGLFKTPRRSLCSGLWRPSDARMCSAGPPPASSAHPERLSPLSATRNLLVPVPAPPVVIPLLSALHAVWAHTNKHATATRGCPATVSPSSRETLAPRRPLRWASANHVSRTRSRGEEGLSGILKGKGRARSVLDEGVRH